MNPQPIPRALRRLCRPLALALSAAAAAAVASAQQPTPGPTPFKVEAQAGTSAQETEFVLRWEPTPRVTRYRLQVARDAEFRDIVFDGAVNGLEHRLTGLPPGRYHWRVAPAPKETGRFSAGDVIEATAGSVAAAGPTPVPRPTAAPATRATPAVAASTPVVTSTPSRTAAPAAAAATSVLRSPANVGWQAAVGRVQRPVPARLRAGGQFDLVAVNSEGTVYALEGANGAALWTARYRPRGSAQQGDPPKEVFTPLAVTATGGELSNMLVAYDGGVRLLEGETGRELWRAALAGRAAGGSVSDLDGKPDSTEIAVATAEPARLYILDAASGKIVSQAQLPGEAIGLPVPYQAGGRRGVATATAAGQLDIWQADGTRLRGVRLDVPFVTPPLVIAGPSGTAVIIGTQSGLLFFDGAELKPLGRITTENDSPRGRLAAADLDGNGMLDIAMVTRTGRVVVVSAQGRISWSAEGGADAYSASFADVDGDGVLDVLVADESVFARGYSGRDGRVIWQAEEARGAGAAPTTDGRPLRSLSVANVAGNDSALIVGGDTSRGTVRAVGMPAANTGRAASR
jgi:outer membrane protein assembly factor BamB